MAVTQVCLFRWLARKKSKVLVKGAGMKYETEQ